MLAAQQEGGGILGIRQNLFQFLQALGRNDEAHLPAKPLLGVIGPPGQTEAVHGNGGHRGIGYLEFYAVVDRPGLIVGHREDGSGNQLLQPVLGNLDRPSVIDVGQLGVILGIFRGNGKGGEARPDGYLEGRIHHNGNRPFRQTADNVAEEFGGQDTFAGFSYIGFNIIGDAGLHIITCEGNTVSGSAQDALDQAQRAFDRYGTGRDIESLKQLIFFTGKAHARSSFLVLR